MLAASALAVASSAAILRYGTRKVGNFGYDFCFQCGIDLFKNLMKIPFDWMTSNAYRLI
jgi:hypothetical protein